MHGLLIFIQWLSQTDMYKMLLFSSLGQGNRVSNKLQASSATKVKANTALLFQMLNNFPLYTCILSQCMRVLCITSFRRSFQALPKCVLTISSWWMKRDSVSVVLLQTINSIPQQILQLIHVLAFTILSHHKLFSADKIKLYN